MKKQGKYIEQLFKLITVLSVFFLGLITLFLVVKGLKPFITGATNESIWAFLTGLTWKPSSDIYGIGYMIVSTLVATIGAIIIAVPLGVLTALAIAEVLPKRVASLMNSAIELLAGIPSVIYGIFGLGLIVPIIAKISPQVQGQSLLAVIIVLTMMILPTIIAISVNAIKAVPNSYKEGSLGLGATKMQTNFKVIIPAAKSGISAGVVLGIGRAIGETMAIILVAGNVAGGLPTSLFDKVRPMTANIALEMSYATGVHQELLFTTGLVLFIFILILNIIMHKLLKAGKEL